MNGSATILRGDARALPLADASVDLVVTSPPYFALRSYTDGGEHYGGQIGAEPTPREYIASLIECTREWVRALKPGGSIWVNLGDKYAQDTERSRNGHSGHLVGTNPLRTGAVYSGRRENGVPRKSLMLLPERYRIACVDQLGLIARAVVIWSKPNGLPESVTDRVRRSHEDWVHLTKASRYFSAVDEIREATEARNGAMTWAERKMAGEPARRGEQSRHDATRNGMTPNPLGKLPGSVWTIPTEPLTVPAELGIDHFAAFPTEWPRRIILGWSPSGICVECGEGRRPVSDRSMGPDARGRIGRPHGGDSHRLAHRVERKMHDGLTLRTITGEACACPEPTAATTQAVVLDPFGGTGTTALVAAALGRRGISVDRSADYCRLAAWRTADPGQRAKARGLPKPPPVLDGQGDLFALEVS